MNLPRRVTLLAVAVCLLTGRTLAAVLTFHPSCVDRNDYIPILAAVTAGCAGAAITGVRAETGAIVYRVRSCGRALAVTVSEKVPINGFALVLRIGPATGAFEEIGPGVTEGELRRAGFWSSEPCNIYRSASADDGRDMMP